jgi:hypothetical protein
LGLSLSLQEGCGGEDAPELFSVEEDKFSERDSSLRYCLFLREEADVLFSS